MSRFVVTITPPTPNGDLHIGHLSGPFLAADVFTRAQRQRGHDCVFVSYSDDYQSYMLRRGLELDTDPRDLAAFNTGLIKRSLAAVDIEVDDWLRAQDNPFFREAVEEVFNAVRDAGAMTRKISDEPYCPDCKVWGYEAFGRGLCNFCGHDSDASQCEECAQAPDAAKMKNFRCKLCGKPQEWRPVERWFLALDRFRDHLAALHRAHPMRPPLDGWIEGALPTLGDWGVTRPGDAGLDLEPDGSCRVHTWFMGLAGYMAAVREYAAQSGKPGLFASYFEDREARMMHFLGYDCAFSHALVYPALLSTMPRYRIGQRFVPNLFLKLDGLNLSTSRGHAIWVADFAKQACSDSIRLYLASVAPEQKEGDFWRSTFEAWRAETFGKTIPDLLAAGESQRGRGEAQPDPDAEPALADLAERLARAADPERFSMKAMAEVVLDAIALARERMRSDAPVTAVAAFIAGAGKPLVPRLSDRIATAFGFPPEVLDAAIRPPAYA